MRLSVETLTPSDAEKLLLNSTGQRQRAMNARRVSSLARAIRDGQWKITHQPIAIDPGGVLVDGQHRVAAIAQAGLNVEVLVARDVDPGTFDVIDTGSSRTPAATLQIAGYANTTVLAAAARYAMTYQIIEGTTQLPSSGIRQTWTPHDIVRYLESVPGERLLAALTPSNRIATALGRYGATTWLGASLSLLDGARPDKEVRSEFLEKLEHGTMLEVGSPILAFRRWVTSEHGYIAQRRGEAGYVGMALFAKSWNAWLDGERLQVAHFKPGREPFQAFHAHRETLEGTA